MKNKSLFSEIISFIKEGNRWWLLPIFIMLIVAGFLIVFSQASVISPFIYVLF